MIYEPAEDSFLIEKFVRKFAKAKKVLDVGAGSGILSRAAIECGAKSVLAVDINEEVVENLRGGELEVRKSDLFENVKEKFDLIVFNPPYLPFDERENPESALATAGGKKGDETITKFLSRVGNYLKKKGIILLLVSSLTPRAEIEKILKLNKMKKEIIARQKIFFETLEIWKIKK